MAHSRVLALLSPFTATPVGYRASEAPSAEHRAASNQRAACSTSRPLHGQRSSACLPRQPSAPQTATLASAHRQPASACVVHSVQSPVLVPVREISEREELRPLPRAVENVADDTTLHNPLARQSRFSPGWMGVVMEYEGVVVEETSAIHHKAWLQLADEEGKPAPMHRALQRADGMKAEQVIQEVFCWTRNFVEVRRLARRKEELYRQLLGNQQPMLALGLDGLLSSLHNSQVPAALAAAEPEERLQSALEVLNLKGQFDVVVSAEDVSRGRPDPEAYLHAAQKLGRPPVRCVVIGNSNQSVEAARECGMAAVVVAGRRPLYEMGAADLVVKQLNELSLVSLKQLFRTEDLVERQDTLEVQTELEDESDLPPLPSYAHDRYR